MQARASVRPLAYEPFDDAMVLHVCTMMRATDAAEIFAMRPDMDAWSLYRDMAAIGPRHLWFELARPANRLRPIALFGCIGTSPGCGQAHLIGTDELTWADACQIADRIRLRGIPAMIAMGMHRVEALSLADYRWAHRFLRRCGARPEGPPRLAMGKAGEAFQAFVWLAHELRDPPATVPATKGE
ncbi:MAG: hypothetical protein V4712_17675 [Pseudomonadota bacterium]